MVIKISTREVFDLIKMQRDLITKLHEKNTVRILK